MKILGTLLAGICAVLVVITGVTALFLFNIERGAFSSEPYKRAFEDLGLYDRMPSILASSVFSSPGSVNGTENPIWALMTSQGVESGITVLLPPAELKTMTDGTLDSIFAYINGDADSASIPLTPFKNHLSSPAGTDAILGLLNSQPACTTEQLFQMTIGALTGGGFFLCNPPPEAVELFRPLLQSQLQFTASILPDRIPLISADRFEAGNDPRQRLNSLRAWMRISPILPILLLLIVAILAVRNLSTFLHWWGFPLLATGVISFLIALIGAPLIGFIIQFLLETQSDQFTLTMVVSALLEATTAVAREILRPVVFQGIALAIVGFVMILAGFLLRRQTQLSTP